MLYDVAVIGAGVVGAFIARELSRYKLRVCVLEKGADIAAGTSRANSAIVHAGYDAEPGTLKARFNVRGNMMMEQLSQELDIPYKKTGSLVLAFDDKDMEMLQLLNQRGCLNGVHGLEVITKEQVLEMEPNISHDIKGALYAPSAGIICPYELTLSAVENAVDNGVELKLEHRVLDIRLDEGDFVLCTSMGEVKSRYIVNASGVNAASISQMVEDMDFNIKPRKGEYMILDKSQGETVTRVIFQPPTAAGKGVLVTPTVHGNLLIGPTADWVADTDDVSTTGSGLSNVIRLALKSVPSVNAREVITSFAGLRAVPSTNDFIIEPLKSIKSFINAAGIESPGLTAAPAIAEYVVELLKSQGLELVTNESFNPLRRHVCRCSSMNEQEYAELVKKNPSYGRIICRCEGITEGEIIDSINRPVGAGNMDAVKWRTRAGMGRCQGGFCSPRVAEILSHELGIPLEQVTKRGEGSWLVTGKTK